MQMIVRNPTQGIYPATSDYVHAVEVRDPARFLYVAGTMGLDEHGVAGDLARRHALLDEDVRLNTAGLDVWLNRVQ